MKLRLAKFRPPALTEPNQGCDREVEGEKDGGEEKPGPEVGDSIGEWDGDEGDEEG